MSVLNLFTNAGVGAIASIALVATNCLAAGVADNGASLAEESLVWMLDNSKKNVSEAQVLQFKENLQKKVQALTEPERLEFLSALAKSNVSEQRPGEKELVAQTVVGLIRWSNAPHEDWVKAFTHLFELETPEADIAAERLLALVDPAERTSGESLSVFRPALEDSKGLPQSRLISHIFARHPADATEWFAKNADLSESERTRILSELPAVQSIANPPEFYPGQPAPKQLLSEEEIDRKVQEWLTGPSWILQLFAKSYLIKYPGRQTPGLQATMQNVVAPANVKLLPSDPASSRRIRQGSTRPYTMTPSGASRKADASSATRSNAESVLFRRSVWGSMILIIFCLLWLALKKYK